MFCNYIIKISLICLISAPVYAMEEREQAPSAVSHVEIVDANKESLTNITKPGSTVCIFGALPRFSQCQEYLWHA